MKKKEEEQEERVHTLVVDIETELVIAAKYAAKQANMPFSRWLAKAIVGQMWRESADIAWGKISKRHGR